ncbi:MAG: hypothetical protein KF703_18915 [Actinobacteria bacterium]|nr:hypothetical protein [Actinomycetota bacterium]
MAPGDGDEDSVRTSAADLEGRYRALAAAAAHPWAVRSVSHGDLSEVEARLGIVLPDEVHAVARFFDGHGLGYTDHRSWSASDPSGVVAETLRLRDSIGLAHHLLFLGETSESVLVLDTHDGAVVECGSHDVERIAGRTYDESATIYPSYLALLAGMIDDELAEQAADP